MLKSWEKKRKGKSKDPLLGKVLQFNENLGIGVVKIIGQEERLKFTYREVEGEEGFKILFPGDMVEIFKNGKKVRIRKIGENLVRTD